MGRELREPLSGLIVLSRIIVCNNQLFTWPSNPPATLQSPLSWKSVTPLLRPVSKAQNPTEHVNGFSSAWWVIFEGCGTKKTAQLLPPEFEELHSEQRSIGSGGGQGQQTLGLGGHCSTPARSFIPSFYACLYPAAELGCEIDPKSLVNEFMFHPIKFDKQLENCNFFRLNLEPWSLVIWSESIETLLDKSQLGKKSFYSVIHTKHLDNRPCFSNQ